MKGIDISSNNGVIDFNKVKASGVEVVYIKATEGMTYTNPLLIQQYNGAKAAGLKIGFYHFLRANEPSTEAKHFLSAISGLISDCKYVIDVELALSQTVGTISLNVRLFADTLIKAGKEVCLYTGYNFYCNSLNSTVKDIPLWVASYSTSKPTVTSIGWQNSETGTINGVNGNIDTDEFENDILLNQSVEVASNMDVKGIQALLNTLNIKSNLNNKLPVIDGVLGPNTLSAMAECKTLLSYITK